MIMSPFNLTHFIIRVCDRKTTKQPCQSKCRDSGENASKWKFALGKAGILRVWGVESAGAMVPADGAMHRGLIVVLAMSSPTQVCICIPQQMRSWTRK